MRKFIGTLACLLGFAVSAMAAMQYEADVRVDVTADTVTAAKKQAMAKATRDALAQVVQSVSTEKSVQAFDELNDNQLQHFISGVMVLMEKSSDVRYIAELRVSVNKEVLKAYMAENDMPFVVGEEQDVLVIPLIIKDGEPDLWGDENVWRKAFAERGRIERGNLNILLIDKNLGNMAAANAKRVFDMADGEYNELVDFNGVSNIYVLKYVPEEELVYVKSFPDRAVNEVKTEGKKPEELVDAVLPFLKGRVQEVMDTAEEVTEPRVYEAIYSYSRLADWTRLKKILAENSHVSDVEIVAMSNGKVRFRFTYRGVIEKLQAGLGVQGFQMRDEGEYYAIN